MYVAGIITCHSKKAEIFLPAALLSLIIMLFRFPPVPVDPSDASFITGKTETFAKLKIEAKAGKRTVFLTEHTLLFVVKGIKLLHFSGETLKVSPDNVLLLKKGIYVMAEYIEEGLHFEAIMLFLPVKLLKHFALKHPAGKRTVSGNSPFIVFPVTELIQDFKKQLRTYFGKPLLHIDELLSVKQKEILLLLMTAGYQSQVIDFIHSAVSDEPEDLDFTVRNYLLQPISIAELANLSNRSLASFKRDFQRYYQSPPRQWINRQRLAHARLLLENTQKRVSEVAQDCGFESISYFIRIFKKEYGYTPQSLRAEITND